MTCVSGEKGAFLVEDDRDQTASARRVVLAYGRKDRIPDLPGLRELYGTSVFHCPDCDGPSIAGCAVGLRGDLVVDRASMETTVPGVYAVGDIVGRPHLSISAAAEGVRAALSIHRSLLPDEFQL